MFVQYVIARWSDRLERVVRLNETSVASLLLEWCDENVSQALSLALCALTWWIQTDFCVCDVFRVYRQTMLNSTTLFHGPQHVELTRLERLRDSFDPRTNQFLSKKERTKEQRWSYRWDRAMHQHKIPGVGGFLSTHRLAATLTRSSHSICYCGKKRRESRAVPQEICWAVRDKTHSFSVSW